MNEVIIDRGSGPCRGELSTAFSDRTVPGEIIAPFEFFA
jgi:hypothetical protein